MRALVLTLLAAILVAPSALAHIGDFTGVFSAQADGLAVFLQADRVVVKAQDPVTFNGTVVSNASGKPEVLPNASVEIEATGAGQMNATVTHREGGFRVEAAFPAPGEWTFLVHTEGVLRRIPIHVYPPTSVWLESSNLRTNYHYAERPVNAELFFLDDETGIVVAAKEPASGRLSRLVNGTPVDTEDVTLPPGRMGSVVFSRVFPSPGSYVLTVASDQHGIGHASLPEIPFEIKGPLVTASPAKTPAPGLLALVAIAAGLALVRRK
ncbi:MAG TPA: hypothetical protein VM370_11790 [Candidatus Thermoplasmatota archaeon]|nr:hypothetical protein [Candidatus Thermoplasmatota archaeon]